MVIYCRGAGWQEMFQLSASIGELKYISQVKGIRFWNSFHHFLT